ncbi:MAG TPA: ankyrin repeat domain-containing protein [Candidatus Dependentiae bacterium]|nr:ankyrin repeat domain-containing protein [Candidatus Dependentiae bacterium]HRQ63090.1 ankyrin repeat domain-containing protein [Candidatus Dependentiae bacterium]
MKKRYLLLYLTILASNLSVFSMEKETLVRLPNELLAHIGTLVQAGDQGIKDLQNFSSICHKIEKTVSLSLTQAEKNALLYDMVIKRNPAGVYKALEIGAHISANKTLLHQAIRQAHQVKEKKILRKTKKYTHINDLAIIMALIPNTSNLNKKDHTRNGNGNTPLHIAAERELLDVATLLLSNGANPNKQNNDGKTAAHIWPTSYKFVELLQSYHANLDIADNNGDRAADIYIDILGLL